MELPSAIFGMDLTAHVREKHFVAHRKLNITFSFHLGLKKVMQGSIKS